MDTASSLVSSTLTSAGGASPSARPWQGRYTAYIAGKPVAVDTKAHVRWCLVFFSLKVLLMNVSAGLYFVTMQPLLVHHFDFDQTAMAHVVLIYCGLAIFPPLIMSGLASRVSSRTIMIWGGFLKLAGMLLYSSPFDNLWVLVVGYVLLLKGAVFVLTATITLFTQLLGRRCTPGMIGILACMYALGTSSLFVLCVLCALYCVRRLPAC